MTTIKLKRFKVYDTYMNDEFKKIIKRPINWIIALVLFPIKWLISLVGNVLSLIISIILFIVILILVAFAVGLLSMPEFLMMFL